MFTVCILSSLEAVNQWFLTFSGGAERHKFNMKIHRNFCNWKNRMSFFCFLFNIVI